MFSQYILLVITYPYKAITFMKQTAKKLRIPKKKTRIGLVPSINLKTSERYIDRNAHNGNKHCPIDCTVKVKLYRKQVEKEI